MVNVWVKAERREQVADRLLGRAITGVVGAAGGLGGFFPPLVIGIVKSATGGYALGFALMALVALACLIVLRALRAPQRAEPAPETIPTSR